MVKTYHCRPSELLAIDHTVQAFYLDKAVFTFGTAFDADIEEHGKSKGKKPNPKQDALRRQQRLQKWLTDEDTPRRFRDPNVEGR